MSNPAVKTVLENVSPAALPEEVLSVPLTEHAANNDEIAVLAYRLWEERGRPDGDPEWDWYEAERMVMMLNGRRQEA
jgi:Protein of unknown function (DUF2934)